MTQIRILTDEDVYGAVAISLRRLGIDAVSTPEVGRRGESDESQLEFALAEGRVIVTFNVAHFAKLHSDWLLQQKHHAGIIVSVQRPIGVILSRLNKLAATLSDMEMRDRMEFLCGW